MAETLASPPALQDNPTLYINNLSQAVKRRVLKEELAALFAPFGEVVDVHLRKAMRMRGQAFVVMASPEAAGRAMASLQGTVLHDRPMVAPRALTRRTSTAPAPSPTSPSRATAGPSRAPATSASPPPPARPSAAPRCS